VDERFKRAWVGDRKRLDLANVSQVLPAAVSMMVVAAVAIAVVE
jgi:hypothetical protein